MKGKGERPTLRREQRLWARGFRHVAGLDEVGRGAWAGPVVAAAVILPPDEARLLDHLAEVRDSKLLTPTRREVLVGVVTQQALALGVGAVPPAVIDEVGIVPATRRAMGLALRALPIGADYLLVDYLNLPDEAAPQEHVTKGDRYVLSIAAASIVAKVYRDRLMARLEEVFPGYDLARNKGYGTRAHRTALAALGPCAIHRMSFAPCAAWLAKRTRAREASAREAAAMQASDKKAENGLADDDEGQLR